MARRRQLRPRAMVTLPPRRLAVAGAVAGIVIAQFTGLVVALLFRATDGEFNRSAGLVALLTVMALGAVAGRVLCQMQGRSWTDSGPSHSRALAAATIAGLAASEALRWAIFRPWEAAEKRIDYLGLAGAGPGGSGLAGVADVDIRDGANRQRG